MGKTFPDDTKNSNRYTRAAETFNNWRKNGVFIQDQQPSFYLYRQEFTVNDTKYVRTGFIAGLKCVEYAPGAVLPHEETLPKAKKDRKLLMKACQANFSSIFGLYDEPERESQNLLLKACQSKEADCSVTDDLGIAHRLWVINDRKLISKVQKKLSGKTVYIADGHHRYETALSHAKEMRAAGKPGYDHVMVTLVNLYDEGLIILPTHRMLKNLPPINLQALLEECEKYFSVAEIEATVPNIVSKLNSVGRTAFVIYAGKDKAFLLSLTSGCKPETLHGQHKSVHWRKLDVSILHSLVLDNILGIGSAAMASGNYIAYTRDAGEALENVNTGSYQLSVLMKPTKLEQVTAVASAGDKMPQKSTYFYPKLIAGLVINPLGE